MAKIEAGQNNQRAQLKLEKSKDNARQLVAVKAVAPKEQEAVKSTVKEKVLVDESVKVEFTKKEELKTQNTKTEENLKVVEKREKDLQVRYSSAKEEEATKASTKVEANNQERLARQGKLKERYGDKQLDQLSIKVDPEKVDSKKDEALEVNREKPKASKREAIERKDVDENSNRQELISKEPKVKVKVEDPERKQALTENESKVKVEQQEAPKIADKSDHDTFEIKGAEKRESLPLVNKSDDPSQVQLKPKEVDRNVKVKSEDEVEDEEFVFAEEEQIRSEEKEYRSEASAIKENQKEKSYGVEVSSNKIDNHTEPARSRKKNPEVSAESSAEVALEQKPLETQNKAISAPAFEYTSSAEGLQSVSDFANQTGSVLEVQVKQVFSESGMSEDKNVSASSELEESPPVADVDSAFKLANNLREQVLTNPQGAIQAAIGGKNTAHIMATLQGLL